ncbi:MAG: hypothetical protein JSS83_19325 [Cyanobacteria bacterium SZAS LIN-3]|nr:hypothetical protein [Cyanobacteria bacterium SZAS LIN-3]MBS2010328.1 hypothetical protein [Cyanobacteria bacterium SZAS TMP-1]
MLTVTGVFNSSSDSEQAIRTLARSGFLVGSMSVAGPEGREFRKAVTQLLSKDPAKFAIRYGLAGATLGALLGVYASMALPAGHVLSGTPLISGLVGVALGTMIGILTGFMFDLGRQKYAAIVTTDVSTAGKTLVSVRTKDMTERFSAEAILEEWSAIETFVKAEPASKSSAPAA